MGVVRWSGVDATLSCASGRTAVASARYTSLEATARLYGKLPIPFHPGAERYLKEKGLIR